MARRRLAGRALRHPVAAAIRRASPSVAVLTLALGIGATTAIYSVVDTILLQPLPFADSDRLVRVVENVPFTRTPARPPVAARRDLSGISRVARAHAGRWPTPLRSRAWRNGGADQRRAPRGCGAGGRPPTRSAMLGARACSVARSTRAMSRTRTSSCSASTRGGGSFTAEPGVVGTTLEFRADFNASFTPELERRA